MGIFTQAWQISKKHPKGKPIFFVDGKRVSLERGHELFLEGCFGGADYLKEWFLENGFPVEVNHD